MEKRNKFKILKRILPIICAVLVTATALTTPIMAIVDSSEGTNQNYDITARSTFPMTVGLAFELDEGNNVTFASDIGGYGQEFNTTQGGTDTFFWTSNASTASQLEGQLEYEFLETRVQDKEYRNIFPLMTNYGFSKASYRPIRITTNSSTDLTNGKDCSSIVYRMSDVVINSTAIRVGNYFSNLQEDYDGDIDIDSAESIRNANAYRPSADDYQYLVPHVVLPEISATAGYYGRYNVIATITDEWGKQWDLNYSIPIDTRGATTDTLVPFLPISIFDSYGKTKGDMAYNIGMSNTVVLNEYYGYLDVDYYEFTNTVPDINLIVNLKAEVGGEDTLIRRDNLPLGEYVGKTFNEWISTVDGQNGYTVNGGSGGITMTYTDIDNDYIYSGTITNSNGANVYGSTIISEDEEYTANLNRDVIVDPLKQRLVGGTWIFNSSNTAVPTTWCIYSLTENNTVYASSNIASSFYEHACNYKYDSQASYFGIKFVSQEMQISNIRGSVAGFSINRDFGTLFLNITFTEGLYDDNIIVSESFVNWMYANATNTNHPTTAFVTTISDEPTPTADEGEWVKVEGTEYGRSATLTLPLWDTSNWTNTNNADYKTYSFPTVEKFLTDVQNSTNIPTDIQQDYTSWIGTATAGFLNMELMPNFSLGGILAILIAFAITMLFLKFFAGG